VAAADGDQRVDPEVLRVDLLDAAGDRERVGAGAAENRPAAGGDTAGMSSGLVSA
jgi:hypothetical protein